MRTSEDSSGPASGHAGAHSAIGPAQFPISNFPLMITRARRFAETFVFFCHGPKHQTQLIGDNILCARHGTSIRQCSRYQVPRARHRQTPAEERLTRGEWLRRSALIFDHIKLPRSKKDRSDRFCAWYLAHVRPVRLCHSTSFNLHANYNTITVMTYSFVLFSNQL